MSDEYGAILIADTTGASSRTSQPMTTLYSRASPRTRGAARRTATTSPRARLRLLLRGPPRPRGEGSRGAHDDPLRRHAAPAGEMPVVMAAGASAASSSTRRSATAWRPTSTARTRRSTPTRSASRSPSRSSASSTTARIDIARGAINVDDEGNVAERTVLVENGTLAHATSTTRSRAKHYEREADRQRPPRELPVRARCRACARTYMLHGPHDARRDHRVA